MKASTKTQKFIIEIEAERTINPYKTEEKKEKFNSSNM